jgi:hypothetical protein
MHFGTACRLIACSAHSATPQVDTGRSSETQVNFYEAAQRYITEYTLIFIIADMRI